MKSLVFAFTIFAMLSHQESVKPIGLSVGCGYCSIDRAMGSVVVDALNQASIIRAARRTQADIAVRIAQVEAALDALGAAFS